MSSLIYAWINGLVNNRETGDWRRNRTHYDVIVMHFEMFVVFVGGLLARYNYLASVPLPLDFTYFTSWLVLCTVDLYLHSIAMTRHNIDTKSTLLSLCVNNSPDTCGSRPECDSKTKLWWCLWFHGETCGSPRKRPVAPKRLHVMTPIWNEMFKRSHYINQSSTSVPTSQAKEDAVYILQLVSYVFI